MSAARKELHSLICLCVFTVLVSTQHLEPNVRFVPLDPARNSHCENDDDCTACKDPFVWHPKTDKCLLPKTKCSNLYETGTAVYENELPVFRNLPSDEPGKVKSSCSRITRQCNASVVMEGFCDRNSHYTILQNLNINATTAKKLLLNLNDEQYIVKASPEILANAKLPEILVEGEIIKMFYESTSKQQLELKSRMEICCRPHKPEITCGEHCRSCTLSGQDMCDENGCEEGYEYDSQTKTCRIIIKCANHCKACTYSGKCDYGFCEDGYLLDNQTETCRRNSVINGGCRVQLIAMGYYDTNTAGGSYATFQYKRADLKGYNRGMTILTIDPIGCAPYAFHVFDTHKYVNQAEKLAEYLKQLSRNTIIAGFTFDDASRNLSPAKNALKEIGVDASTLKYRGKMAFVAQIGQPGKFPVKILSGGGPNLSYEIKLSVNCEGIIGDMITAI